MNIEWRDNPESVTSTLYSGEYLRAGSGWWGYDSSRDLEKLQFELSQLMRDRDDVDAVRIRVVEESVLRVAKRDWSDE